MAGEPFLVLSFPPSFSPFSSFNALFPHLCPKIGLNTNLLYQGDKLSEGKEDPGQQVREVVPATVSQLSWLREALTEVRLEGSGRAIIFAHVPPGVKSRSTVLPSLLAL